MISIGSFYSYICPLLYEDDGETYNYEKGEYATIELAWEDAARRLIIGARQGTFPGMVEKRPYRIVLATPSDATGIAEEDQVSNVVEYSGKKTVISLN